MNKSDFKDLFKISILRLFKSPILLINGLTFLVETRDYQKIYFQLLSLH